MEKMKTKEEIGKLLRQRREYLKLTQQEVAEQIPMSRSNYTNYENGVIEFSISDLQRMAQILRVPMTYFFPDEVDYNSDDPPIEAYYRGLPPDKQDMIKAMIQAAHEQVKRSETTHGKKAE